MTIGWRCAKKFGATDVINAKNGDATKAILELTDGRGVAAAWEAVGATPTVQTAVNSVRKGGHVTLVGNVSPNGRTAAAGGGDARADAPWDVRVERRVSRVHRADGERRRRRAAAVERGDFAGGGAGVV